MIWRSIYYLLSKVVVDKMQYHPIREDHINFLIQHHEFQGEESKEGGVHTTRCSVLVTVTPCILLNYLLVGIVPENCIRY